MKHLFLFFPLLLLLGSCHQKAAQSPEAEPARQQCNAVYYWKTTFRLSAEERDFLATHQVKRLYLRYFDVYKDPDIIASVVPVPQATLQFIDSVPSDLEVVPTVFIDNNLFKDCDMSQYAGLLVNRILTMTQTNDVPNVHEVQLDCDWTQTTERSYFNFLRKVDSLLHINTTIPFAPTTLSTTIRLHQLKTKVPPVERGVLMCYNTGGIRNPETGNSILAASDVSLYAKNLQSYSLPLDVAYPAFSWAVWFSGNKFQALLRDLTPENESLTLISENRYKVKEGFYQEGKYLSAGDEIRFEASDFEQIMQAKSLLEKQLQNYSIILYHLDSNNLSKYSEDEINKIYAR